MTIEGSRLSAMKVIFVFGFVALSCDDGTLKINQADGTGGRGDQDGGAAGGGMGVLFDPPNSGGAAGGGSAGGGSAGGSASGGSAGGGSGAGGGTGGVIDDAVVVAHTLPAQLACSQRTNVTVTVRNMGDTTWTAAGNYRLGAVDDQDPLFTGGNRIDLGAADSVAPGQEYTFNIELLAPGAGTYPTDWRMVHDGVQWFGATATSGVTVACAPVTSAFFPCVIDGQFDMPDHDQRIASRNASLLRTGHVITGNDSIDNAVLGGGSPDGGIWLSGQFHFEIDANGQITAASWIAVFSPAHNTVTGGVYPNGEIHMGSPAGLDISGLISNGLITGFVAEAGMSITRGDSIWNALSVNDRNSLRGIWHGNDLEYVHGVMSGTWAAR